MAHPDTEHVNTVYRRALDDLLLFNRGAYFDQITWAAAGGVARRYGLDPDTFRALGQRVIGIAPARTAEAIQSPARRQAGLLSELLRRVFGAILRAPV